MNIIYVSSTCSRTKYNEYIERKGYRVSQQAQKYNWLLASGFVELGLTTELISTRPINRKVEKKIWFRHESDIDNGIRFSYLPFVNAPIFRNIFIFFGIIIKLLFHPFKSKDTFVVCDALNIVATLGTLIAAFFRKFDTLGIITDVPCHLSNTEQIPFYQRFNLFLTKRFSSYLLLTKDMNEIVNPHQRPYVVLEGHADIRMASIDNKIQNKAFPRICLYAGSLKKIYGIKELVEGFIKANLENTELHIYGDGDYTEELTQIISKHNSVKYLGVASNDEIVSTELKSTLLINPRPTNAEYTKYSFPSKNMEYMSSGTPVLTTLLPGMPDEYRNYVYLITNEDSDGICDALTSVLSLHDDELHAKGMAAKDYIISHKNNVVQAKKVVEMIANIR